MNPNLIKKLIQIPSFSGKEGEIREFLTKFCQENSLPVSMAGENLVVKFNCDQKKLIIFNAHLDTISAGDLSRWKHLPFGSNSGKVVEGKIYGLGASDEKASIASLMLLTKELKKRKLTNDVWLTFVVKEETDGSGTQSFLELFSEELNKYNEIVAIICEPTGLKEIQIGHKGNVFLKITTFGDSGHGSEPQKIKKHAVLEMYKVINKVKSLEKRWQKEFSYPFLGRPTIGIATAIKAGKLKNPNKFPDSCIATFDVRTTPELHDKVKELIEKELSGLKVTVDFVYSPCPFGLTDKKEKIVRVAKRILKKAKVAKSESANDLCFFTKADIPAIILGPGEKEMSHKPNEFCYLAKVEKAVKIYKKIVDLW